MSDLDDFLKAVSEAKQKDPISEKVKQVKTNIKEDLGDLFSQISVIKEQDPVQQKNKKIEKQVQESVKMDLGTLFSQLSSLKNDLEEELVVAEAKLVEVKSEDILTEVSPIPALPKIRTPEQRIKDTNADIDKYLTGKSFQQPDPDLVSKDVEAIRTKIKFLEQAIGRIAAAGPGGGEVNLRYLDDVDRSTIANGKFLRYNETKKKFEFASVFEESTVINGTANQIMSTTVGNVTTLSLPNDITAPGDLTVTGNLTVNGTTTTVNSVTLTVDDNNIELGSTAEPSDTTANGGGFTLRGATNKTISWSTLGWTSSEDFNLVTGKVYEINGTSVLSATTLGSGVTASSLTSLGTIASLNAGTITASADATINGITIGKGIGSVNQDNVKIGNNVLTNNLTGEGILAVGSNSMAANTTGKWIAAFGGSALGKNTTGIINCAFGSSSLGENTIGSNNIGFGDSSLRSNVDGGNNVGIGFDAGRFISTGSGLSNINQSIFIGNSTKSLANSETNTIVIGYNAVGLGSNTTVIGNSSTTKTKVFGTLETTGDATINTVRVGLGAGAISTNTVVGFESLNSNTTGGSNVALGYQAALSNTTGVDNMAIGKLTLRNNSTGSSNIAVGNAALYNNNGSNNVAIGTSALNSGTTFGNNTAIGHEALKVTTANSSVAIGYRAFVLNTSGGSNTGIGNSVTTQAITDTNSIVIGNNAVGLGSNTTVIGTSATTQTKLFGTLEATGDATVNGITIGRGAGVLVGNLAYGPSALASASLTGLANTAVGQDSLLVNTTGANNLGIGFYTLRANITGSNNIAVGPQSLKANITGSNNIAVGESALSASTNSLNIAMGTQALNASTTGNNNVVLGYRGAYLLANSVTQVTNLTQSVFIGNNTKASTIDDTNSIAIGHNAQGLGSNTTVIGNSSTTQTKLFGTLEATGDATINGVKVGKGNGNQPTNLAVGFDALSGSLLSTATTQNVGIGNSTLSNIASTVTQIDWQSYNNTVLVSGENVNNIQLTYDTGTPVESGGTYPIINLQIYDDDGNYYLGDWQIVDGGSKFVNTTTRFRCQITTAFGNQLDFTFYIVSISTGSGNTAIGYLAGSLASVGTDCLYIGRNANPNTSSPPRTNEIVIGAGAIGAGTNTARIGNSNTTLYVGNLNTSSISVTNSIYAANQLFETSTSANFNLYGTSTGASTISSSQTSGTLTIGGTSTSTSAGTITLGRATGTSTVNIGTGVPATSRTKTINIGTSATTPSGTTLINIGANALTTTTIRGPAVTLAPLGTASAGATRFSSPYLNLQLSKFIGGVTYTSGLRISSSCDSSGTEMYLFDSNYGEVASPDRGSLVRFNFPNTYLQVMNRNDNMGIQYGATFGTGYMGLVSVGASFPSGANTNRYLYGMYGASFAQGSIIPATGGYPNFRNILDNGSGNLICGSLNTGLGGTSTITATNFLQINHTTPSTSTTSGALQVAGGAGIAGNLNVGGKLTVTSTGVPTAFNSAGTTGTITWDADYIYVCVATNTWKRSAITTW